MPWHVYKLKKANPNRKFCVSTLISYTNYSIIQKPVKQENQRQSRTVQFTSLPLPVTKAANGFA